MTVQEYETKVWPFYLRLEKEFMNTLTYVEFSEDNFSTYSIEYEKQLLSVGSEVDMMCKLLCKEIDAFSNASNMDQYAKLLCTYNDLTTTQILFQVNRNSYIPFDGWTEGNNPSWWKAYNRVKHERLKDENYKQGNLKNVFVSLAGLYVLNRFYFKVIKQSSLELSPNPQSQLFTIVGWNVCIPIGGGYHRVIGEDGSMAVEYDL